MMRFKGKVAHKFAENPLLQMRLPTWRSRLLGLLIIGSFVVLIGRAFYLQVLNNDFLQEKGESRYRRDIEISASRGRIADRQRRRAGDIDADEVGLGRSAGARLTPEQIAQLASVLEMNPRQLAQKLDTDKTFVFLRRQIPPAVADRVAALKLPGIGQDKEYRRFYPTGEMTAHMVGFTGVDDRGLEGVELAFQASCSVSREAAASSRIAVARSSRMSARSSRRRTGRKFAWRSTRRSSIWRTAISSRPSATTTPRPAASW
jgi:cell division protein FtsI (penicillin-binding protein 3)